MLTLQDLHCPICQKTAQEQNKGFMLCKRHGWIKPVKAITLAVKRHKGISTTLKNK